MGFPIFSTYKSYSRFEAVGTPANQFETNGILSNCKNEENLHVNKIYLQISSSPWGWSSPTRRFFSVASKASGSDDRMEWQAPDASNALVTGRSFTSAHWDVAGRLVENTQQKLLIRTWRSKDMRGLGSPHQKPYLQICFLNLSSKNCMNQRNEKKTSSGGFNPIIYPLNEEIFHILWKFG